MHFGLLCYWTKLDTKRVELAHLMQKLLPRSPIESFSNERTRSTQNSNFGASRSVWVHLAMFQYYTKLGAKLAEQVQLMQKFVPWSRIRIFQNERTQSTPSNPNLMFWCVSTWLGVFSNISLLHETWCKTGWTGAINAQVHTMKSHRNFSQQTHPIQHIEP